MRTLLTLCACLVLASCTDPVSPFGDTSSEIVIEAAKKCKPEAKNENACVASGGFWAYWLDIGYLIEDPIDDVLIGYCDCTPVIEL